MKKGQVDQTNHLLIHCDINRDKCDKGHTSTFFYFISTFHAFTHDMPKYLIKDPLMKPFKI